MASLESLSETNQGQAGKPRELQGLGAEDSWSCEDEAVAEVTNIFCEPLEEQFSVDVQIQQQQQIREQKHAQPAITDSCFHSTGIPVFFMQNIAFCTPRQRDHHGRAPQPGTYLLGVLVTVVDEVAGNVVFGPHDSIGRPGGVITTSVIDKLDRAKLLSEYCQKKWLTFLQPWHAAGWDSTSLSQFANVLRPLQYRNDLDEAFIRSVSKSYLQKYIGDLFTKQGFAMVERSDVEEFLDIVHRLYSQRDAVLLPAEDAASKLCKQTKD